MLVCAWASGRADAAVWHWALALVLMGGALYPWSDCAGTWTGVAVAAFVLWAEAHTFFLSQSYTPAGLYQPLFLAIGFALGRRAFDRFSEHAWSYVWAWAIVAIVCYALFDAGRTGALAAAPFETPAVLAALVNLALLPVLAHALWGSRASAGWFVALALLAAGLIAAASRGGWIGLLVGFSAALVVLRGRIPAAGNVVVVAGAALCGAGLVLYVRYLGHALVGSVPVAAGHGWAGLPALLLSPSVQQLDSSLSRLELYALALDHIARELPLGSGYLSFAQILEAGREFVPSYGSENLTYFVHNDYLQTLLELGLPGLGALAVVVVAPLAFLLGNRDRIPARDQALCAGCAGGIAATAFQACVDFPLYIPACLAGFGFLLGTLTARCAAAGIGVRVRWAGTGRILHAAFSARRIALIIGGVLLTVPLATEWSLAYGQARWRLGLGQEAAYGFELARRLQPGDWRYAWYAGKFWTAQATTGNNERAGALADIAFKDGFAASPREVKNLLGRIQLHRSLVVKLELRATFAELESWSAKAIKLAPRNPEVRLERIFVLERVGKLDDAYREATRFAQDEPGNSAARFVAARLAGRIK